MIKPLVTLVRMTLSLVRSLVRMTLTRVLARDNK